MEEGDSNGFVVVPVLFVGDGDSNGIDFPLLLLLVVVVAFFRIAAGESNGLVVVVVVVVPAMSYSMARGSRGDGVALPVLL